MGSIGLGWVRVGQARLGYVRFCQVAAENEAGLRTLRLTAPLSPERRPVIVRGHPGFIPGFHRRMDMDLGWSNIGLVMLL